MKKLLAIVFAAVLVPLCLPTPAFADDGESPCYSGDAGFANGPAGRSNKALLYLCEKDMSTWEPVDGAWGKMSYNQAGAEFSYNFIGHGLKPGTGYTLIYYPDPWPGNGLVCLGEGRANRGGNLHIKSSADTGNLPSEDDDNAGAKVWLVLAGDVQCGEDSMMTGWNGADYLFEWDLITFAADD